MTVSSFIPMGPQDSEFWIQANPTDERQYPSHLVLTIHKLDISFELQSLECNKHSLWVIQTKKMSMLFAVISTVFHQGSGLSHTIVHNCEAIRHFWEFGSGFTFLPSLLKSGWKVGLLLCYLQRGARNEILFRLPSFFLLSSLLLPLLPPFLPPSFSLSLL